MTDQQTSRRNKDSMMWAHNWVWCAHDQQPRWPEAKADTCRFVRQGRTCPGPHHPILVDVSTPDQPLPASDDQ